MEKHRIKRLSATLLLCEVKMANYKIQQLERSIGQHRSNPSENAVISQMEDLRNISNMREHKEACEAEICSRKQNKTWNLTPVERSVVKLENAPQIPILNQAHKPENSENQMEGEELPIKVFDKGIPRAWRPEDGPIHGSTPDDTITDVSKTVVE